MREESRARTVLSPNDGHDLDHNSAAVAESYFITKIEAFSVAALKA